MHYGAVVIRGSLIINHVGLLLNKINEHSLVDIALVDMNILVSIRTGLLVPESQAVANLVHDESIVSASSHSSFLSPSHPSH